MDTKVFQITLSDGTVADVHAATGDEAIEKARRYEQESGIAAAPGIMGQIDNAVRTAANSMTFGFADKFAAKMNNDLGLGDSNSYEGNLVDERWQSDQAERQLGPYASTGIKIGAAIAAAPKSIAAGIASPALRYGARVLEGAGYGALDAVGNDRDVLPSAGVGAGIAAALPVAGRIVSPLTDHLSGEARRLAGVLQKEGVKLTPAQSMGSRGMRYVETTLENLPGGGASRAASEAQQQQFNRAVLKRAGIDADVADPTTIDDAFARMGTEYDNLYLSTPVRTDKQLIADTSKVLGEYMRRTAPHQRVPLVGTIVRDVLQTSNVTRGGAGQYTGEQMQSLRSELADMSKTMANSDPAVSQAAQGLLDAFSKAYERSAPAGSLKTLQGLDRRYSNLKDIQKALEGADTTGNITGPRLRQAVQQSSKGNNYVRGKGDLNDLSRAGSQFLRKPPDSGTAQRTYYTDLLTGGGGAVTGFGAAMQDPYMLAAGGLALGGPLAANTFINSGLGRAYLGNRLMSNPKTREAVLSRTFQGARSLLDDNEDSIPEITIKKGK